jgi:sarcosine oxidase
VFGEETTATTRTFERDDAAFARVTGFLERYLPSALGPVIHTKTCLYTLTPDRDFVLDTLPERPDVSVAIGGGHGFKFASVVGRILAELAVDGRSTHDLGPFGVDRAILQLADPPRTYMV